MRAFVYDRAGDSGVLREVDRPIPEPGPGEVRVRIVVSGVNPTDWKRRSSANPSEPTTPNQDGAGVVDAVGAGVEGLAAGDRVWVLLAQHRRPTGTAQEYAVLPRERVVALPDGVSFDVGATLGIPALTAHRALTVGEDGPDRLAPGALAGSTVLVTGGAGAVGHAAIQLARWAGARVIATVSGPVKGELARRAGAPHVVNYREGDPAAEIRRIVPDGVDTIAEVDLIGNAELASRVIRVGGTVASYANSGLEVTLPIRRMIDLNARVQFLLIYGFGERALRAATESVAAAVAEGALPVGEDAGLPITRFPFEETPAAHDAVQRGTVGKVLIDVDRA